MRLSKDRLHKLCLLAATGLFLAAMAACTAGHRSSQEAPPATHPSGTDGATGTSGGNFVGTSSGGSTNAAVGAFNDLSLTIRSLLAYSIVRTASRDVLSTTDADDTTGNTDWNTGVTQSSDNPGNPDDPAVVNWAINARFDGDDLVFDRTNLLASSPVTLTTSGDPEAPAYRRTISLTVRSTGPGLNISS